MKLCDFGFAKIDQGDLMTPQFTPYYVAPQVSVCRFCHRMYHHVPDSCLFYSTSRRVLQVGRGELSFRNLQAASFGVGIVLY